MTPHDANPQIAARLAELFGQQRPTRWVTRERPKIDRIACPWLIRRFIDQEAVFLFAPTSNVFDVAKNESAVAFDIPGARFSHAGEFCSFDAFLTQFGIADDGLELLAPIIRGADTDRHDLAPQASGLHAVSIGLSLLYGEDLALLEQGVILYDALYAWASEGRGERHAWNPGD